MAAVPDVFQITVYAASSIAAVVAMVLVWRDDHTWLERNKHPAPVAQPDPGAPDLHDLVHSPRANHACLGSPRPYRRLARRHPVHPLAVRCRAPGH